MFYPWGEIDNRTCGRFAIIIANLLVPKPLLAPLTGTMADTTQETPTESQEAMALLLDTSSEEDALKDKNLDNATTESETESDPDLPKIGSLTIDDDKKTKTTGKRTWRLSPSR